MIYGIDTSFLVQLEVREVPGHEPSQRLKERLLQEWAQLGLAPQTLCEFIHIVTDPRRFEHPLSIDQAVQRSEFWWNLQEVTQLVMPPSAVATLHRWMLVHRLGRKRILDTMLAATFEAHEITRVITSDPGGFSCFECFELIDPLELAA